MQGKYETKYSKMDQVKLVENNLDMICLNRPYYFKFFKG